MMELSEVVESAALLDMRRLATVSYTKHETMSPCTRGRVLAASMAGSMHILTTGWKTSNSATPAGGYKRRPCRGSWGCDGTDLKHLNRGPWRYRTLLFQACRQREGTWLRVDESTLGGE